MSDTVPFDIEPVRVLVNGKWPLYMPPHRAERPEWTTPPYWEGARLERMFEEVAHMSPTIWDIGAEEGDMPALYASWGADVVLVEPNPKVWPCIRYHWKANDLSDPAGCYVGMAGPPEMIGAAAAGVWSDGWPACSTGDMFPGHGFHHLREHAQVDSVATLDQMLEWFPTPDIITADIEGGEGHMLKGASTMLADVRPVWFLSVHSAFMKDLYGQNAQDGVFDVFKGHGYTAEFIEDRHEAHWVFLP